ncbi:unnamed protein product, partial [Symbiodinium necroappetens]
DFGCDLISSVAMALVDSEAAFAQRCKEVDAEGLFGQLAAQGLTTFAKLAYACGTPQEKPTSAEFEAFTGRVLGAAPRLGDVSLLKRLMFEAATFVIAQLKQAVQSESTEAPRRLPAAEKMAREVEQRNRLAGVNIERELADREAFLIMAAEVRDLRPRVDGSFPMSVALDALRTDPRITMFLMAMPFKRSVAVDVDRPPTPPGAAAAAKTRSAKRREREKRRRDAEAAKRTGADPPRRADPPNKGARLTPPAELASCHQKTVDGKPICWSHNLK